MSGIFASMNTATKGLMASQTALHTSGHNITNMNTEGFTRQRVDMKADRAFSYTGVGQLGTGVKMEAVVRMIDDHVSKQIRTENSTLNRFTEKSDVINQLEVIFNEPSDTGLNFNISEMFDAFQKLSNNPEDLNSKTVVVEKLKTVADMLNHMSDQIEGLETETHEQINKNVLDFNSKVEQLNSLNKQIFNVAIKGQTPNDLLDQRDLMLKEVTAIADVDIDIDEYGRVSLDMKQKNGDETSLNILTKDGTQEYIAYDKRNKSIRIGKKDISGKVEKDENGNIEVDTGSKSIKISNGKILGNMDAIEDVNDSKLKLDDIASKLAQSINHVHGNMIGKDEDGNSVNLGKIFTGSYGGGKFTAKDIKVNTALKKDNGLLRAGKAQDDGKYIEGDNSLAIELAGLRDKKISLDKGKIKTKSDNNKEIDETDGSTIGGSYRDMIIKIGVSKQHSDNMVDNQMALTNQLEMRRESVSGVSLNDEITNVIKFQKSFEANAKVLSALTEMLDVLINRTGV